jgi:hypothetical protein
MELFCLAKCSIFKFTSKKKPNRQLQRKFCRKKYQFDDTDELKEEQRNDKLHLVEISVIALSRTIFVSGALW